MKVLMPVFSEGQGGLEMYVLNLARELRDRGHDPHLVSPPGSFLDRTRREENLPGRAFSTINYVDPRTVYRLKKIISNQDIDVVHVHDSKDYWYGAYLKLLGFSGPLVATQHMRPGHKDDYLHRVVYDQIDRFLAITEDVKRLLVDRCDRPTEQIEVLHYGIPPSVFNETTPDDVDAVRKELEITEDSIVLGVVGRIDPQKRQELLIEAGAKLRGKGYPVEVVVLGGAVETVGEEYEDKLRSLATECSIEEHVHFLGFRNEVEKYMAVFDVLCLTTDCETFGKVLIESQAVGTPVVATDAGGAPEALVEGETGLLFEPRNGDDLATKVETLLSDPEKRRLMGHRGKEFVRKNFSWEDHFDRVESIYRSLTNRETIN